MPASESLADASPGCTLATLASSVERREDQPGWQEQAEFVDALIEAGTFVMGGPFSDYSGSVNLLEGVTAAEAVDLLESDPFVQNDVFVVDSIRDWTVYVDELSA